MPRSSVVHRCQCVSTRPGSTTESAPSMTVAPGASMLRPTAAIRPSRTCTSPCGNSPSAVSMVSTYAPRITKFVRAGSGAPVGIPDCALAPVRPLRPSIPNDAAPVRKLRRPRLKLTHHLPRPCRRPTSSARQNHTGWHIARQPCEVCAAIAAQPAVAEIKPTDVGIPLVEVKPGSTSRTPSFGRYARPTCGWSRFQPSETKSPACGRWQL